MPRQEQQLSLDGATQMIPADKVGEMEAFSPGGEVHQRITNIASSKVEAYPTTARLGWAGHASDALRRMGSTLTLDWPPSSGGRGEELTGRATTSVSIDHCSFSSIP